MNIALISPMYFPHIGGVDFHVMKLATCLTQSYHDEVEVLTTDPTGKLPRRETIEGVSVSRFKSWAPGESYCFSRELQQYLRNNSSRYDVVHAHSYHDLPALYAAQAKTENSKLVFSPHYHGGGHTFFRNLLHKPYRLFGKNIFMRADAIICVSKYERDVVTSNFPDERIANKIVIIPNGVDMNVPHRFSGDDVKDSVKNVLYVGRLEKYKRIDAIIHAIVYLNESQRVCLEIIGTGPEKQRLMQISQPRNDQNLSYQRGGDISFSTVFVDKLPRDQLLQKYADADVLVNLSDHEAYGLTVAEALVAGTPCVVSNSGALREWVDDENCIGISNPRDRKEVAGAIRSLLDKRVVHYERLIDWSSVTQQVHQVYEKIIHVPERNAILS